MAGDVNGYDRFMMSCPDENIISSNWEKLSDSDQKIFIARTGLSGSYWSFLQKRATGTLVSSTDYVSRTNSKEHLDAVAWAAWKTVPVADMWFIEIAKDNAPGGRMDALALAYLQIREVQINTQEKHGLHYSTEQLYPLANGKSAKGQSAIDLEMIMRIARRHNGGSWWLSLSTLKSLDAHNYVKRIAGIGAFDSEGNYPALHCSSDAEIIKRGVAMMPLNLK